VLVWIEVGSQLVKVGSGALAAIRGAVDQTDEAGNAILDEKIADYDRRIERRRQDAEGQVDGDPTPID